jgi:hypothetical protein
MMALISAALVLGFAQSVFFRPWFPDVKTAPETYFYFHGLVMFAWMALFTTQVALIATRKPATHRMLGIVGIAMIPLMTVSGLIGAAITGGRFASATVPAPIADVEFMGLLCTIIFVFAAFAGLALAWRRDLQSHKRLMLLAAIVLVEVAVFRWPFEFVQGNAIVSFLTVAVLLMPIVVWDFISRGSLHPVTLWGGAAFILYGIVRLPIAGSATWHELGRSLVIIHS